MSFDEEWAQLVAKAAQGREVRMRLNGHDGGGGGGSGKTLHVTPGELTKRAGRADNIRGNLAKADDSAMRETKQVASGLKGFKSAGAFAVFQERWAGQMTHLQNMLGNGVAGPLRTAADELQREDSDRAGTFKDVNQPADSDKVKGASR
ncbi:WXG100 family type VII secretion target [Streptomyces sp. URMC 125]|uniref:WXG100 family type VII secretion target n=1 Tax=Streptomyces sp. URMC 125 TaxID=3423419 RepID=UPI003F1B5BCB